MKQPRHGGRGLVHHNLATVIVPNSPAFLQTVTHIEVQ